MKKPPDTTKRPKRMSVQKILAAARAVRAQVKRELTEDEINKAKRHGRL